MTEAEVGESKGDAMDVDEDLWIHLHLERESMKAPLAELQKLMERGVEALRKSSQSRDAGIRDLLLQHADACRRVATSLPPSEDKAAKEAWTQMRETFERAASLAETADDGSICQVLMQWLRLEAYAARNATTAMDVGNRLMKMWGGYYNAWSTFITAMRYCKVDAYSTLRGLYHRAMEQVTDYPAQIRSDHVQFEREWGTLTSWREARDADAEMQLSDAAQAVALDEIGDCDDSDLDDSSSEDSSEELASKPNIADLVRKAGAEFVDFDTGTPKVAEFVDFETGMPKVVTAESKLLSPSVQVEAPPGVEDKPEFSAESKLPTTSVQVEPRSGKAPTSVKPDTEAGEEAKQKKKNVSGHEKKKRRLAKAKEAAEAAAAEEESEPEMDHSSTKDEAPVSTAAASEKAKLAGAPEPQKTDPQDKPQKTKAGKAAEVVGEESLEKPPVAAKADGSESVKDSGEGKLTSVAEEEKQNEAHKGSHYHQKRLALGSGVLVQPETEGKKTVYVSNLDWSVDEPQLRRMFGEIDGMKEVRLVEDFLGRSKGYAYIDYEKPAQVDKAVEKWNGFTLNKRAMFVARSLPTKPLFEERTIFVKNLAASATESQVREAFSPKGEIVGVRIPMDESAKTHKGYAYVEFASAASTDAALALDGIEVGGQKVHVARSIPMKDHRHQKAAARKDLPARANQRQIVQGQLERSDPVKLAEKFPTTIYVKNLAFPVDEARLREHFRKCGEIQQVMVCRNAQGRSRGFGFVEFATKDQAQDALAYNDTILCEREIWVSKSQRAITQKGAKPPASTQEPAKEPANVSASQKNEVGSKVAKKRKLDIGEARNEETGTAAKAKKGQDDKAPIKQFRSAKEEQSKTLSGKDGVKKEVDNQSSTDAQKDAKPMSNADFRAMVLAAS